MTTAIQKTSTIGYYASSSEGTSYRYQADGSRVAYATGFSLDFFRCIWGQVLQSHM